jgi:hypothetical protein
LVVCLGKSSYLADELHVTVLNTVVDHLDVVTSTLVANPLTASLAVTLGGDALEDILDMRPGLLVTTGHERGAVSGTLLTTGDTGADEADVLASKILGAAVGVGEVRVTTVDDDVAGVKEGQDLLNPVVDSLASLDQEHDTAGRLELADELLDAVGADNGLALGLVLEESVDLGDGSVEGADGEAVVSHVQNKVLSPVKRMSMSCYWQGQKRIGVLCLTYMTARPMRPRSALATLSAFVAFFEAEVEEVCC